MSDPDLLFLSDTAKKRKSDKVRAGASMREIWAKDRTLPFGQGVLGCLDSSVRSWGSSLGFGMRVSVVGRRAVEALGEKGEDGIWVGGPLTGEEE